jgi:SAM-dependent methyltransferase
VAHEVRQDIMLAPFDKVLLSAAAPQAGERVLDVGCGFGTTTLEVARAVGEQGRVVALDVSETMMARLRSRAAAEDVTNVVPLVGDAQTDELPGAYFDLVVSRYGVMFFDDPVAAFANIREAMRRDGRLAFVCWQPLAVNEFMAAPLAAMRDVIGPVSTPAGVPGPFAFSDQELVRKILTDAGYRSIVITGVERPMVMGGGESVEAVVEHGTDSGPARRALAEVTPQEDARARALLRAMIEARPAPDRFTFTGATWLVTARAGTS